MKYYKEWIMENDNITKYIDLELESYCPNCNKHVSPNIVFINFKEIKHEYPYKIERTELVYRCTNTLCNELYTVVYRTRWRYVISDYQIEQTDKIKVYPFSNPTTNIPDEVKNISTEFEEIYIQAMKAENYGLHQVCGMGYRKALEFLVKDFAIFLNKDNENAIKDIKNKSLKSVIDNYIKTESKSLQIATTGAAFLGNDETHYERKNPEFNITDLKKLIKIAMHTVSDYILLETIETTLLQK